MEAVFNDVCNPEAFVEKSKKGRKRKEKIIKFKPTPEMLLNDEYNEPEEQQEELDPAVMKRLAEIETIQLITKRNNLIAKLNKLNIKKGKDARKIAAINVMISDIDYRLKDLQKITGKEFNEVNTGSKFGRFWNNVKTKATKIAKKVKKFFKRNKELVIGIAAIALPAIGSLIFNLIKK